MKNTKRALMHSIIALLLCVAQLLGTTFAWFTDSVTSTQNIIKSGNLDLEMYWTDNLESGVWYDVEDDAHNTIFGYDNWEPGYTEVRYIKIINKGDLAFNYDVTLAPKGEVGKLAEVINVYFMEDVERNIETREELLGYTAAGLLSTVMNGGKVAHGTLLPAGETDPSHKTESTVLAIGMTMLTTAGNEYQKETVGDFTIKALATQLAYENDSFGTDYDKDAAPVVVGPSTGSVTVNGALPTEGVTIDAGNGVTASIPGDVALESGADKLTLSVYPKDKSDSNITVDSGEHLTALDVHIDGVADTNTKPITVELGKVLPEGLNMGNYTLAHVENGSTNIMTYVAAGDPFTAHNQYKYDPATGNVTIYIATFSEIAVLSEDASAWKGNFDYSWYTNATAPVAEEGVAEYIIANADQLAAFGAIVGGMNGQKQDSFAGKTVKLVADINLGDKESENNPDLIFYPIGYNSDDGKYEKTGVAVTTGFYNFVGTFDGNGHTISNFYQNTWEMKGDNNYYDAALQYYRDGMGLFGKVYGGTVKNLTVSNFSSDGEYTTTGVIAAYADGATFENIAITYCNPRVYNTGNGGIVGCVGWYAKEAGLKTTFTNITVDNSNKISALWGSYDVACGGLVGQYYPTSGQSSADYPKNAGIDMVNCHVSAIMDVYNDVCGNYQYYAYRYAGMMIGSIRENTTNDDGKTIPDMTGISATGCTVNYGDWNDYYYCEFEKNGHPSYSGPDDYKFSRVPHSELNFTDSNGNGLVDADERASVTGCKHTHTAAENNKAIYLPFHQLFTGYGWGVNSIGLEKYSGIVTNLGITEGEQEESVVKFESRINGNSYETGTTLELGEIFFGVQDAKINLETLKVFVSPVGEGSTVSAVYTPNTDDWTLGTLAFSGIGAATITITDYTFCKETVTSITIRDYDVVDKFKANDDLKIEHILEGDTIGKTLGDVFSAVENAQINSANVVVSVENNNAECIYTKDSTDWKKSTLAFTGTGSVTLTITDENYCNLATATVDVQNPAEEDLFGIKFPNVDSYLYRLGNGNEVKLSSLFEATLPTGAIVNVTVDKIEGNVSGTFTNNTTTWTNGTIQFTGTGVAKITIDSNAFTVEKTLMVEVVGAKNITRAESATANDVVLLNDISGTFTVSNGHTFYGNGFTVTLPTSSVQEVGQGFTGYISIGASQDDSSANGGNLDNVRIEGPVYPEMYIYRDQATITDKNDPDYSSVGNMRYFRNSVIVYGGNCTISNSYISGSRTALCLRGGNNVVIENTTLSGGAYANMQICAGSKVTLRNLTTVQVGVTDSYGKGKTAHGLGIAVDSGVVDIYIEGELNQHNWLNKAQWNSIVPSAYQSQFPKFFDESKFEMYWHYLNGVTGPYVNLAFIYACNWDTSRIHDDNRTTDNYGTCGANIAGVAGGVYSKVNTVGGNAIVDVDLKDPEYTSPGFNPVSPVFKFDNSPNNDADDTNDAADTYCEYNESNGTLKIGVNGDSKTIDLSGVTISKNGAACAYKAYLNGTQISGNSVTVKAADGAKQTLTFKATSNDAGYDKNGNPISGSMEYTWTVTVEIAVLSYPAPVWNMGGYQFGKDNFVYAYYSTSSGYGEAVQIYEGIKINYYDKTGTLVNLDLSGTTTHPTGSDNSNSNAFTYTLTDGSTLTMKFSSGWKSGATTHQFTTYGNKVYIYPQSLDNDNYIRAGVKNQDFDVKILYTFTDPNGQSITQTMQWYNAKASNNNVTTVQWKKFDSTNGKEPSCITPDTLITLADGTQVRVDSLTGNEELLVWNLETGALDSAPIMFVDSEDEAEFEVIELVFSDGTSVKVIYEHGFWDHDLNKYVYLDRNAEKYIGHSFAKLDGDGLERVTLTDVVIYNETTTAWSPVTVDHLCYFTNGMLSMPGGVGGLFNIFDVDADTMSYDLEALARDIETYGLFTYEELAEYAPSLTKAMFDAAGGKYLKISIGKGNLTMEELAAMINRYSVYFE